MSDADKKWIKAAAKKVFDKLKVPSSNPGLKIIDTIKRDINVYTLLEQSYKLFDTTIFKVV